MKIVRPNHMLQTMLHNMDQTAISRTTATMLTPTTNDVLFGRGRRVMMHPGNLHFHQVVNEHRERYQKAKKLSKMQIAKETIQIIRSSGGRFLTRNTETGLYEEADEQCIRDKVSHLFRGKSSRMIQSKSRKPVEQDVEHHLTSSSSTESLLKLQKKIFESLLFADKMETNCESNNTHVNTIDDATSVCNTEGNDRKHKQDINDHRIALTENGLDEMCRPKTFLPNKTLVRHVSLDAKDDHRRRLGGCDNGDLFQIGFDGLQEDELIVYLEENAPTLQDKHHRHEQINGI